MQMPEISPTPSFWGHVAAVGTWVGTLFGLLPALAALVAVIWYMIQIYESTTVQKWLDVKRLVWKARRIAHIRAEQKLLQAQLEAMEIVREARVIADSKVAVATTEAAVLKSNAEK